MQIILASAKIMNTATDVQLPNTTQPRFGTEANKFALELNERSVEELQDTPISLMNKPKYQLFWLITDKPINV